MSELIKMQNVNLEYVNASKKKFFALKEINLAITRGEYISIIGTSGSGKTTLSNVIGLLSSGFTGDYRLDGLDISRLKDSELVKIRSDFFGFIFQDYVLIDYLTAIQNVALALHYTNPNKKEIYNLAREQLIRVGLGDKLDHLPYQLSGGQKQRVSIARALIKNPKIIIADEPTGALDPNSRVEILSLLQELNEQGVTILTVTHSADDASASKRVIRIEKGSIVSDSVQLQRTKFFGKLMDVNNSHDLDMRRKLVDRYLDLNLRDISKSSFIKLYSEFKTLDKLNDQELLFSLCKDISVDWIDDKEIQNIFFELLELNHPIVSLVLTRVIIECQSHNAECPIIFDVARFFNNLYCEVTLLYFLNNLRNFNIKQLSSHIDLGIFLSHPSDKIRATSVRLLKYGQLFESSKMNQLIHSLLSDHDARVRSNTLDFLLKNPEIDVDLSSFDFNKEDSGRVKAAWIEMLKQRGKVEEAWEIMNSLLLSSELSDIQAGAWIASKEDSFDLTHFFEHYSDLNPYFLLYIDEVMQTVNRNILQMKKTKHEGLKIIQKVA
jgi:putative ABC transport system ATP-binding protein